MYDIKQSDRCDASQKQHNDIVIIYNWNMLDSSGILHIARHTCHLYLRSYQLFIKYSYGSVLCCISISQLIFDTLLYNTREKSKRICSSFCNCLFTGCQRLNYNYFKNCHKWVMVTTLFILLKVIQYTA